MEKQKVLLSIKVPSSKKKKQKNKKCLKYYNLNILICMFFY